MSPSPRRLPAALAAAALAATGIVAVAAPAAAAEGDLLISEYVEGTSFNKAIELYNPGTTSVDLAAEGYTLQVYFAPSATPTSFALTGTVAAGDVFVFAQGPTASNPVDPAIGAVADQTTTASLFNGDDTIAVAKNGVIVDVLGQIGTDPGTEWGTGNNSTQDNTLRRASDICVGDPNGNDVFDPTVGWVGYATNTFDGLGSHTADCGGEPPAARVVINEFSADTAGMSGDVEYVELLASPVTTDLSAYRVLEIEGDLSGTATGTVDEVIAFPVADAAGRSLAPLGNGALENGSLSLLLVTGTFPALGTDIDANDDGVIDDGLGFTVVDAVAVKDADADLTYGGVTLGVGYDGLAFDPGGASRIPDGADTDAPADWVRNDFDLAGYNGTAGTPVFGEAFNTPGAVNGAVPPPPPIEAGCDLDVVAIGSVQGAGAASERDGDSLRIEGTVVGDFQSGGFDGFYVQDAGDELAGTSDGVFVYLPGGADVSVGSVVSVAGEVDEFFGLTRIRAVDIEVCATGQPLPEPVELTLPATPEEREALEGMYVTLPQQLTIGETFDFARFGTISLTLGRQYQPTGLYDAGSAEAAALAAKNVAESIGVDDGRSVQNPDPAVHPNGEEFTLANTFRSGDLVQNTTGILDYRFDTWAVQPTQGADFAFGNPRPGVPEVGGDLKVASFNVLNYFTTLTGPDARGANDPVEFERQEAKIVTALAEIDADVFGLIEIENNATAVAALTEALNERIGADVYDYVDTGVIGTDVITTALLYKPASVTPAGAFQLMDESKDPRWLDDYNRPGLTQTFEDEDGAKVTVVVNHLKSKGSDCNAVGDPVDPNGQGNCNGVRTQAAAALADWLATDPTGQGTAGRELILGDLNSYAQEDPIQELTAAGYTDLLAEFDEPQAPAYSYVFDGQLGYLDYALAGQDVRDEVTGAAAWNVNADEASLIDYDMTFKAPAQDAIYAPDEYRSSDHDPVIVGLSLTPPDVTPPTIEVAADPSFILVPNNKMRTIEFDVDAADDRGDVTVALTGVTATGSAKAEWEITGDRTARIKAVNGVVYEFTWTATDAAGNTSTDTARVVVGLKGLRPPR
ncbi:ExeM/NucH family extracellular endonuclease [Microbacterium atlanticum]|uniref:ExeM/NucH family extracellular endonuclease n=1 Tax=Microbacterium atlanticum TaxID=2782168 RepID=UPI001E4B7DA5|nr:ExeM/NucH family extracellular endonuclease [Microbacterium atlanticum]